MKRSAIIEMTKIFMISSLITFYSSSSSCSALTSIPPSNPYHSSSLSPLSLSSSNDSNDTNSNQGEKLLFQGRSSSKIIINDYINQDTDTSQLIEWLEDNATSNPVILGTPNIRQVSEDTYDCIQPPISWFGLDLVPVFVNQISRNSLLDTTLKRSSTNTNTSISSAQLRPKHKCHEYTVNVEVKDSRTDLKEQNKSGRMVNIVKNLMEKCQFRGTNTIKFKRRPLKAVDNMTKDGYTWEICSDLSIQLTIPLPKSRFILLPPGFNVIGSRIVKATCEQRSKETLEELKKSYIEWLTHRNRLP